MKYSPYYIIQMLKQYVDTKGQGTSSLWPQRMAKGYGQLLYDPSRQDHQLYSSSDIEQARKTRILFYERLLSPQEIRPALRFSPVVLDVDIYDFIFSDTGGIVTLPDPEDQKSDIGHCFLVFGETAEGLKVHANTWPTWGTNGTGFISDEYLTRNFVTAFATTPYKFSGRKLRLGNFQCKYRKAIRIQTRKWFLNTYHVLSVRPPNATLFNIEISNTGGILVAWLHLAIDKDRNVEIQELFVLNEYRRLGLGSFLFNEVAQIGTKARSVQCYISAHDLIGDNENILQSFLLKNDYTVVPDRHHFKDARFAIRSIRTV